MGSLLGGGFHVLVGYGVRAMGRTNVTPTIIWREASKATIRFGGVLGLFAGARCASEGLIYGFRDLDSGVHRSIEERLFRAPASSSSSGRGAEASARPVHLLPSLIAGALAVALPTAAVPERQDHIRTRYSAILKRDKKAFGMVIVLGAAASSGAFTFGLGDYAVRRLLGLDWS